MSHRRRLKLQDQREKDANDYEKWEHNQQQNVKLAFWSVVVGILILGYGLHTSIESEGASKDPVPVELADLEAGLVPPDKHLRIGRHVALFDSGLKNTYRPTFSHQPSSLPAEEKLSFYVYPIVSTGHAHLGRKDAGRQPKRFAVLVKTGRYELDRLPRGRETVDSIEGLLVSVPWGPNNETATWFAIQFPDLDPERLLILSDGHRPTSNFGSIMIALGGLFTAAAGLAGWAILRRRRPPKPTFMPTRPSRHRRRR